MGDTDKTHQASKSGAEARARHGASTGPFKNLLYPPISLLVIVIWLRQLQMRLCCSDRKSHTCRDQVHDPSLLQEGMGFAESWLLQNARHRA